MDSRTKRRSRNRQGRAILYPDERKFTWMNYADTLFNDQSANNYMNNPERSNGSKIFKCEASHAVNKMKKVQIILKFSHNVQIFEWNVMKTSKIE